ncbi:endospore germination permease [Peribacillus frigoritolerans]
MSRTESKISQFQLFFIILQTQIGIELITLPYEVFKISKVDAWISILLIGLFVQINIVLIWLLYRRFPSLTIFEMMSEVVGRHLAFFLKFAYIVYFFSIATLVILLFGRMVNIWILPRTPIWILVLIMIVVCVLCAKENLRVMARFYVVVSALLIVFIVLITSFVKNADYLHILPIGQSGLPVILKGTTQAIMAFLGYELLLVVLPYSLGNNAGKLKVALIANGMVTILYLYLTIFSIAFFGPSVMKFIPEPILYIMKYTSFQIIERTDLLFLSIWVVTVGTTFMMYLYLTSNGLANMFTKIKRSTFVYCTASVIFILAFFIPTTDQVISSISKYVTFACYFFIFVLPCILLIVSILRGKKEEPGAV